MVGSHTFTAAEIKAFAAKYDPQPFNLDEAAAARSPFGALCASGWLTVSIWMRLLALKFHFKAFPPNRYKLVVFDAHSSGLLRLFAQLGKCIFRA